jgi:hypothetical protein
MFPKSKAPTLPWRQVHTPPKIQIIFGLDFFSDDQSSDSSNWSTAEDWEGGLWCRDPSSRGSTWGTEQYGESKHGCILGSPATLMGVARTLFCSEHPPSLSIWPFTLHSGIELHFVWSTSIGSGLRTRKDIGLQFYSLLSSSRISLKTSVPFF